MQHYAVSWKQVSLSSYSPHERYQVCILVLPQSGPNKTMSNGEEKQLVFVFDGVVIAAQYVQEVDY